MGNLLGGGGKKPQRAAPLVILEKDQAILKLKTQRDKLKKLQKKIAIVLEQETALAKELYRKKKIPEAKAVLRKKKYQENMMESTDAQITNLEQLVASIQEAAVQQAVLDGLSAGNAALKTLQDTMSIDDVQQVMDGLKDGLEYANEIQALVGESITEADEDALQAEMLAFFPELVPVDGSEIPDAPVDGSAIPDAGTRDPVAAAASAAKEQDTAAAKSKQQQLVGAS